MKINSNSVPKIVLAGMVTLFFLTGAANNLWAHDGKWDPIHHVFKDKHGYWDEHDHYQKFGKHNGHHGFWDKHGKTPTFVNVD